LGVDVNLGPSISGIHVNLVPRLFAPGSPLRIPRSFGIVDQGTSLWAHRGIQVFPGSLDVTDPSHVMIPVTIDGSSQIIDGWLKDDGTILLEPRKNP
jgi:hypothetical protein